MDLLFLSFLVAHSGTLSEPVRCDDNRIVAERGLCETPALVPGPYMIFFRWGGANVDRDAQSILDTVVRMMVEGDGSYKVALTGYSDRSGPAAVNKRISRQRALVVRDLLLERGVEADRVVVRDGGGEAGLLVPTADGVREAQNRRVEIHFIRID
ncbi:OmpA family protein [Sphingomicrobium arenosum]|uniref:OmpA family protein n=1 Tax=Sphingomicrobium arenosum TaxID=2233861 RepID=UPI00223F1DA0|nr:OmpA family protein [Sphingomicrobium arenosum]